MRLAELRGRRILVLGLGREGLATAEFLRVEFPGQAIGIADRLPFERLHDDARAWIAGAAPLRLHLGDDYAGAPADYDVIVKSPGVAVNSEEVRLARSGGRTLTSQAEIFLANWPGAVVGVTGTKGKSTTTTLIDAMLRAAGRESRLVGNIGHPSLPQLRTAPTDTVFVYELSSQQLGDMRRSPPIAVLLGLAPEHLDYHGTFADYLAAKENITRHQSAGDVLVYNAASPPACEIAARSRARRLPFALDGGDGLACFVAGDELVRVRDGRRERLLATAEIALPGRFNLHNVLAAVTTAGVLDLPADAIVRALREFEPLEHRFERVAEVRGITFYNASIATVPEATAAHLDALPRVDTLLAGGHDRGRDFEELARRIVARGVATLILFPTTGERLWQAVQRAAGERPPPRAFFTADMEEAVALAFAHTPVGGVCLHSPAAASFGLFRDYRARGEAFKASVRRRAEV